MELILSLVSGLIGAVVGGLLSAWGAMKAVKAAQRDLEADELRRLRLDCLVNIVGLRFVLTGGNSPATIDDKSRMTYELNRAMTLWFDHPQVCAALRDIRLAPSSNIVKVIRLMAESTSVSLAALSDRDLEEPFVLNGHTAARSSS